MVVNAMKAVVAKADNRALAMQQTMSDVQLRIKVRGSDNGPVKAEQEGMLASEQTDVRASVQTQPKRVAEGQQGGAAAKKAKVEGWRVLHAHTQILACRSQYFIRAFSSSGWREGKEKAFSISVDGEEEFEDLSRLIRLSYEPSYIKEGDQPLTKPALLRLLRMADRFEFNDCVKECVDALGFGMTLNDAMTILDTGINTHPNVIVRQLVESASDCVARRLGPVSRLFEQTPAWRLGSTPALHDLFILSDKTKGMPALALEAALRSDNLVVESESQCFWLLLLWLRQRGLSQEDTQDLFNAMFGHLRLHHMTEDFLADVIMTSPLFEACPNGGKLVAAALRHRGAYEAALTASQRDNRKKPPIDRGMHPSGKQWEFRASFDLADCRSLGQGESLIKVAGLADGLPFFVEFKRGRMNNDVYDPAGLFFGFALHMVVPNDDPPTTAVPFKVSYKVGEMSGATKDWVVWHARGRWVGSGWHDVHKRPWNDVISDESPYVADGAVHVDVKVTIPTLERT